MRRSKNIITKGHLLIYTETPEKNDEIWTRQILTDPNDIKTLDSILVFTSGNVGSFSSDNSNWRRHMDVIAPIMCVWPTKTTGGASGGWGMVNNENSKATMTLVVPREDYNTKQWKEISNPNAQEISTVDSNPEQSVELEYQCTTMQKRDLSTFDIIDSGADDIELDVDWGN